MLRLGLDLGGLLCQLLLLAKRDDGLLRLVLLGDLDALERRVELGGAASYAGKVDAVVREPRLRSVLSS